MFFVCLDSYQIQADADSSPVNSSMAQANMGKTFFLKPADPQGCPCYTWQDDSVLKKLKKSAQF